jgi:tRNA (pseudouridine54-N1)-methyltransferase
MMKPLRLLRFIQILPTAPTQGDFSVKDLPGSGKRIDILCRDLSACFDWGSEVWSRSNLELRAVLGDSVVLTFRNPGSLLPLGEARWAQVIRDSLTGRPPGFVQVKRAGIEQTIKDCRVSADSSVWLLEAGGRPFSGVSDLNRRAENSFILGDHQGFASNTLQTADKYGIAGVSLGKASYLSSHCVAIVISEYERMNQ